MLIENLLVEHGILGPHTGQYLMRPKLDPIESQDRAAASVDPEPAYRVAEPTR